MHKPMQLDGTQTDLLESPVQIPQPVAVNRPVPRKKLRGTQTNLLRAPTRPSTIVPPKPVEKKQPEHRTASGNVCTGNIRIPGLGHSLCDTCNEWIPTSKWDTDA